METMLWILMAALMSLSVAMVAMASRGAPPCPARVRRTPRLPPLTLGALIAGLVLLACTCSAAAEEKELTSGQEVFQHFKDRYHGEDGVMDMRIVLTNKRGESRTITLLRYRRRENGLTSTVFFYVEPADVRGTATLTVEQAGADDDQRIYLPSLLKHRRIAASDKGKSWLGTDLRYEDIQEKKPEDFTYSAVDSDAIDGVPCYHFTMTPKQPDVSAYGKLEYWIRKNDFEMPQGRYYDKKGRLIKVMRMGHIIAVPDTTGKKQVNSPTWMMMYNLEDAHKTIMITDRAAYNVGLAGDTFTPRFLESVVPPGFKGGTVTRPEEKEYTSFDPEVVKNWKVGSSAKTQMAAR